MERRSLRIITLLIGFIVAGILMLLGVAAIAADQAPLATVAEMHDREVEVPQLLNYREVVESIVYPDKCRTYGIQGTVYVKLLVGRDGRVKEYFVIKTPHRELTGACRSPLRKLAFSPARDGNGAFVEMWVGIPIKFQLDD